MKNQFPIFVGVAVLALTVGLNVRHALNDYGVKTNKLHLEVLAQTSTTGGGSSTTGGGSTSGGATTNPPDCPKVEDEGKIIVVTVCKKKTSIADALLKISCGTESESTCQFTNVK